MIFYFKGFIMSFNLSLLLIFLIITPIITSAYPINTGSQFFLLGDKEYKIVKSDDYKYNLISKDNKYFSEIWFDDLKSLKDAEGRLFFIVEINAKFNIVTWKGTYLDKEWFDNVESFHTKDSYDKMYELKDIFDHDVNRDREYFLVERDEHYNFLTTEGHYLNYRWSDRNGTTYQLPDKILGNAAIKLWVLRKEDKHEKYLYTLVNQKGKRIKNAWFKSVKIYNSNDRQNFFVIVEDQENLFNIIDANGNYKYKKWYNHIKYWTDGFLLFKEKEYHLRNLHGELVPPFGNIKHFKVHDIWGEKGMIPGFLIFCNKNGWNAISKNNDLLINNNVPGESLTPMKSGYSIIKRDGLYNIIAPNSTFLSPEWYNKVNDFYEPEVFLVKKDHKWNVLNSKGKCLFTEWYDKIDYCNKIELFRVKKNHKWNVLNSEGECLFPEWYDYISKFTFHKDYLNGLSSIKKNGRWTIVDQNGNLLSDRWYDDLFIARHDKIRVTSGTFTYYINNNNKIEYLQTFFLYVRDITNNRFTRNLCEVIQTIVIYSMPLLLLFFVLLFFPKLRIYSLYFFWIYCLLSIIGIQAPDYSRAGTISNEFLWNTLSCWISFLLGIVATFLKWKTN
jgi:hypothetical protein